MRGIRSTEAARDEAAAQGSGSAAGPARAVLLFALLVVVGNVGLAASLDAIFAPEPGARRNPNSRQLWPEFVAATPARQPGEIRVLLIANSQGFAPELADEETYARHLERDLARRTDRPVRVLNWSIPAGGALDFVILAAAAHAVEPDVTLLVASPGSFRSEYRRRGGAPTPLSDSPNGVRFLLADSRVRARLPASFREHHVQGHDRLELAVARLFPLWRYRDLARAFVFAPKGLRRFEKDRLHQRWFPRALGRMPPRPEVTELSFELLDETVEALAGLPGQRILAQMPAHSGIQSGHPDFGARASARCAAAGVAFFDLSGRIPDARFLTWSHLDAEGHARFASLLLEGPLASAGRSRVASR